MKRNAKSFLIWTASILVFVLWMLSVYESSFAGIGEGIHEFVKLFPNR